MPFARFTHRRPRSLNTVRVGRSAGQRVARFVPAACERRGGEHDDVVVTLEVIALVVLPHLRLDFAVT